MNSIKSLVLKENNLEKYFYSCFRSERGKTNVEKRTRVMSQNINININIFIILILILSKIKTCELFVSSPPPGKLKMNISLKFLHHPHSVSPSVWSNIHCLSQFRLATEVRNMILELWWLWWSSKIVLCQNNLINLSRFSN